MNEGFTTGQVKKISKNTSKISKKTGFLSQLVGITDKHAEWNCLHLHEDSSFFIIYSSKLRNLHDSCAST